MRIQRVSGAAWLAMTLWLSTSPAGEFRAGKNVKVADPLDTIRVTIQVGEGGMELAEQVDLHLGVGFPLRLFPLGGKERKPAFAAVPSTSSLAADATTLQPGESATFEFRREAAGADTSGSGDADVLRTTPELFRDLRVRDLQSIGFASLGKSDWVLAGYRIEANGELLAEHKGLNLRGRQVLLERQAAIERQVGEFETLARQAEDLEAAVQAGLASDEEIVTLRGVLARMTALAQEINSLSAVVSGGLPWYRETGAGFPVGSIPGKKLTSMEVTLTPAVGDHTGSANPLYLWVDGRKFSLSTENDPLANGPVPQTFHIPPEELELSPVLDRRIKQIGIGMVGSDRPADKLSDRSRLQRVRVRADGQTIYDSAQLPEDRRVLASLALTPPAHRDEQGKVRPQDPGPQFVTLWKSGSVLTDGASSAALADEADSNPSDSGRPDSSAGSAPPPLVLLVSYDPNALSPPHRRTPPRRHGRTPIVLAKVAAPQSPGGPGTSPGSPARPITPTPAPAAPVLSNIRINSNILMLRDGDQATVSWQVSGDASNVRSYRVDLFGVLPHKNPPLIGTPLATQTGIPSPASRGRQSMTTQPPAIQAANIRGKLQGAEAQYLYAQPKVTALDSNGKPLVSGFGSILPLFPPETPVPPVGNLYPGFFVNQGRSVTQIATPPSFQVLPATGRPLRFTPYASSDPGSSSMVWTMPLEQDSSYALTFEQYLPPNPNVPLTAQHVAVRPANNGERVSIQFEGGVALPSTFPTPPKGWRLVGHVAFLGGNAPSTAKVQTRVYASVVPASPPFFAMQTSAPITYSKFSSGTTPAPCLLIDMPVRFDLMAANNLAASPHNTSKYAINTFVPNGPNGFAAAGTTPGGPIAAMMVTLMISQQSSATSDAVGVFGLRFVPDSQ